jgi:hypothetical protein
LLYRFNLYSFLFLLGLPTDLLKFTISSYV